MENKVPEVTVFFWICRIMATTLGESGADALDGSVDDLGWIFVLFLAIGLALEFYLPRVYTWLYWANIVMISVVGTKITDLLTDVFGVELYITMPVFFVWVILAFAGWYCSERTLDIHTIHTTRREAWYWFAVLATFAEGTALGDLITEEGDTGYWPGILIFGGAMVLVSLIYVVVYHGFKVQKPWVPQAAFWVCYVLSRPLGASMGDALSQDQAEDPPEPGHESAELGPGVTCAIFGIIMVVTIAVEIAITWHRGNATKPIEGVEPTKLGASAEDDTQVAGKEPRSE